MTTFFKILLAVALFFCFLSPAYVLAGEATYINGKSVKIPDLPIYDSKNPGPLAEQLAFHRPTLKLKRRKEGLEDTWRLTITIPHPIVEDPKKMVTAVYVTDKDNIIVGYLGFSAGDTLSGEIRLNGILNYIQIYVYCLEHGLWKSEYRLSRSNPS